MPPTTSPLQPPPRLPQKPPSTHHRTCLKGPQPDLEEQTRRCPGKCACARREPIILSQLLQRLAEDDSLNLIKAGALRGSELVLRLQPDQSYGSTKQFQDTTIHGESTTMQKEQRESRENSAASQPQACTDSVQSAMNRRHFSAPQKLHADCEKEMLDGGVPGTTVREREESHLQKEKMRLKQKEKCREKEGEHFLMILYKPLGPAMHDSDLG
nr:uncharacterized protein LOC129051163 [Pongo abelii]XP_054391939.1 uncharacterized protein LOC129051167 [Pongo abelii]